MKDTIEALPQEWDEDEIDLIISSVFLPDQLINEQIKSGEINLLRAIFRDAVYDLFLGSKKVKIDALKWFLEDGYGPITLDMCLAAFGRGNDVRKFRSTVKEFLRNGGTDLTRRRPRIKL
jgi:hypothetical protein